MNENITHEDIGHSALCFCGTCKEAFEAGLNAAIVSLNHQCPQWTIQTAYAQLAVAQAALIASGVGEMALGWFNAEAQKKMYEIALSRSDEILDKANLAMSRGGDKN